jgi:tetratricopeptide (TPR) repeat protein
VKYRIVFTILSLMCSLTLLASVETDRLLHQLDEHIAQRDTYMAQKQKSIDSLMELVMNATYNNDWPKLFNLYDNLLNEYQSFNYDSAFKYVNKLNNLAPLLNDYEKTVHAKMKLGFTLLSSGLFKESLDTLESIDIHRCSRQMLQEYYRIIARTYYDLADYDSDEYYAGIYRRKGSLYLDSAIAILSDDDPEYWASMGLMRMKINNLQGSIDAFNFLISEYEISDHLYAIATSSMGYIYTLMDRDNEAIDMLIRAAIADITSSTKETVALRNLAMLLMDKGDIDRAYRYIRIALEDATFYNARHRKTEVGEILPIIEGEQLRIVESQKKKLGRYSIVVTVLSVLVLTFFLIIFIQLRKLVKIRKILQETNTNLKEMNHQLTESNIIKEEYIGYFFNINSEFIQKLESYRKTILRKLATRQFDDLTNLITSTNLKMERENMFLNFDKIFLKLFPRFVDEFNTFFREEERIQLKHDELLNTDLRIFALMRLGITDSEKIAKFLDFSVNTIYTYKTKIKHKAIIDRDSFDERVMEIKAL